MKALRHVFVFEKGDEEACNACLDFSVNEKPGSKIFLFKILGGQVGLYGLEFKGPGTNPQNRFLKLTDLHSTVWAFRSARGFLGQAGGLGLMG